MDELPKGPAGNIARRSSGACHYNSFVLRLSVQFRMANRPNSLPIRSAARSEYQEGRALVGIMHLAKGLEFKAVVVMACDEGVLPLQSRIAEVADEFELDEVISTERQLLYVAATRARDRHLITGQEPGSDFLDDLA